MAAGFGGCLGTQMNAHTHRPFSITRLKRAWEQEWNIVLRSSKLAFRKKLAKFFMSEFIKSNYSENAEESHSNSYRKTITSTVQTEGEETS